MRQYFDLSLEPVHNTSHYVSGGAVTISDSWL